MAGLLRLGAVVDQGGGEDPEGGDVQRVGHVVRVRLLGERPLVLGGEPEAAVLRGEADAGEAAVPELALQRPLLVPAARHDPS